MHKLTLLDQMVLESLNKSDKTLNSLMEDTSLPISLCNKVLENLLIQNIITISNNNYSISKYLSNSVKDLLKDKKHISRQLKALIDECIYLNQQENNLSYYKVNISDEDEKILNAMFINIESFINQLKNKKGETKNEKFIFWGKENYSKLIHSYIS